MQENTRTIAFPTARHRLSLLVLFAAITLAPLTMVHAQWLTGPLVNTMLLLTCALVGPVEAVILGLLPSTLALASGLLPLPLAPTIPFIMIGNALYIAAFHYAGKKQVLGVLLGSAIKYLFLFFAARLLLAPLIASSALPALFMMLGTAQLVTALIGGVLALGILTFLPRRG